LYFTFADSFSREVTNLRLKTIRAAYDASPKIIVTSIWALCEQRLFYAHREVKTYTDGDTLVQEELIRLLPNTVTCGKNAPRLRDSFLYAAASSTTFPQANFTRSASSSSVTRLIRSVV
jgi:hypothetical protein